MRVNVYAEEMTNRVEIISKEIEGEIFTGVRFYLYLPVSVPSGDIRGGGIAEQVRGPFMHHPGDDDSAAVTFWGKKDLRTVLQKAIEELDKHEHGAIPGEWTAPERAIVNAMYAVEHAGAHPLLTDAVTFLGEARKKVREFEKLV